MNPMKSWMVALGLDGRVLGVERGAPTEWVGTTLEERTGVAPLLSKAASAVVAGARANGLLTTAHVVVPELDARIDLVALPVVWLHRAATEVAALLHGAVAPLELQGRARDVALKVAIDPDVPSSVSLDAEKIAWAVSALVGNALRYARSGTRHMPGGSINVRARRDVERGELVLEVTDDGPGIPTAVAARMFERAPGAAFATGLALSVVRDIASAHGGSLALVSSTDEADPGTTVTLRLPLG